jgi:hypothetical protein
MRIDRPSIGVEFAIVVNNDSNVNPLSLTGSRFGWIIMQEDQGLEADSLKMVIKNCIFLSSNTKSRF